MEFLFNSEFVEIVIMNKCIITREAISKLQEQRRGIIVKIIEYARSLRFMPKITDTLKN